MESQSSISAPPQHDLSTPSQYKILAPSHARMSGHPQFDMMPLSHSTPMVLYQSILPATSQSTISSPPQNPPLPQPALEGVPKKKRGRPRKIRLEGGELEPKEGPTKPEQSLFSNFISIPDTQDQKPKKAQPTKKRPTEIQDPNDTIPKKRGRPPKPKPTPDDAPLPPNMVSFHANWFREEWEFSTLFNIKTPLLKVPVIWTRPAIPEGQRGPREGFPVMLTDHRGLTRGGYTWEGKDGQRYTSWKEELDQSNFPAPVNRHEKVYRIMNDRLVDEDFCADPPLSRKFDLYQYNRDMPNSLHQSQPRDAITHFTEDQIAQLREKNESSRAILSQAARRSLD